MKKTEKPLFDTKQIPTSWQVDWLSDMLRRDFHRHGVFMDETPKLKIIVNSKKETWDIEASFSVGIMHE